MLGSTQRKSLLIGDVPASEDEYVTDGRRLFRVIAPLATDGDIATAVLEDCATLAWRTYSAAQLRARGLRPVARSGAQ